MLMIFLYFLLTFHLMTKFTCQHATLSSCLTNKLPDSKGGNQFARGGKCPPRPPLKETMCNIHTYVHTYIRTYVHTYIHTNIRPIYTLRGCPAVSASLAAYDIHDASVSAAVEVIVGTQEAQGIHTYKWRKTVPLSEVPLPGVPRAFTAALILAAYP